MAALKDERDFLLTSLDDLEREHAAGDVDEHDYAELSDDYTTRAARVIRAIEANQVRAAAPRSPSTRRRALVVAGGVAVFALLAGVLVAQASGRRQAGDNLTGDIREATAEQLEQAAALVQEQRLDEAIAVYDEILEEQPDHVEAMTYKGWLQFQSGDAGGLSTMLDAAELDRDYPDVHALLAIALSQLGLPEEALAALNHLDTLDPPAEVLDMVAGLRAQLTDRS